MTDVENTGVGLLPDLLTGPALDRALAIKPAYSPSIRLAPDSLRLAALQALYEVYVPTSMSQEIYTKIYLALARSLQKKQSMLAVRQFAENHNRLLKRSFSSIMGGSDSFTIIGPSGIGKSAAVSRAVDLVTKEQVIELPNHMRILPCVQVQTPADCSVKGLLLEILRRVDEMLDTSYYHNALRAHATTDLLIGSVSSVALSHIGLLVVDEIQNVVGAKSGRTVVGTLTQLINNSGISICMVGTPESSLFFESNQMLARRALGLSYGAYDYGDEFVGFCSSLYKYQYVRNECTLNDKITYWLYQHSGGNASVVVSLIQGAQEIAILEGSESLNLKTLEQAYEKRLTMLHDYLYQEPVRAKSRSRRGTLKTRVVGMKQRPTVSENGSQKCTNKGTVTEAKSTLMDQEQLSTTVVEEAVLRGRRLNTDITDELKACGLHITEVIL